MNRILIISAALITMGAAANAATLSAGALFGGSSQNLANCLLYNAADSDVTISDSLIASTFVGRVQPSFNNCRGVFTHGSVCNIQANIVNNAAHACKVVFSPNGAAVRGVLMISNSKGAVTTVLQNVQLR
jgi:hypothetical protein